MFTPYFGGQTLAFMKMLVIDNQEKKYTNKKLFFRPYFNSATDLLRALFFLKKNELAVLENFTTNKNDYDKYLLSKPFCLIPDNIQLDNEIYTFTSDDFKKNIVDKHIDCDKLLEITNFDIKIPKEKICRIEEKIAMAVDNYKGLKNSGGNFDLKSFQAQKKELIEYLISKSESYNSINLSFEEKELWPNLWETDALTVLLHLEEEGYLKITRIYVAQEWCNYAKPSARDVFNTSAVLDIDEDARKKMLLFSQAKKIGGCLFYSPNKGIIKLDYKNGFGKERDLNSIVMHGRINWQKMIFDIIWKECKKNKKITFNALKKAMEAPLMRNGLGNKKDNQTNIKRSLYSLESSLNKIFQFPILIIHKNKLDPKKRESIELITEI